jgi:hypothetical protein
MAVLDADPQLAGKWRAINNDPQLIAWCNGVHEFSGTTRLQLRTDAFNRGDSERCRDIFKAWIAAQIPQRQRTETRLPLRRNLQ